MQLSATTARGIKVVRPSAVVGSLIGPRERSLFESLFPSATVWHKALAVVAFIVITALLARARFYLPDNPVPITFSTYGVLMTGGVLGWRWGIAAIAGYYLVGMAGAPVFQGGNNGWSYATDNPTAGYLLGFILASAVIGYLSQRGWTRGRSLWPMLIGALILYIPALIWLSAKDFGWPAEGELFSAAMYPFIPGDVVKLMMAALSVGLLWRVADARAQRRDDAEGADTPR